MACRLAGDKLLFEPVMISLLTQIWVSRPQCVSVFEWMIRYRNNLNAICYYLRNIWSSLQYDKLLREMLYWLSSNIIPLLQIWHGYHMRYQAAMFRRLLIFCENTASYDQRAVGTERASRFCVFVLIGIHGFVTTSLIVRVWLAHGLCNVYQGSKNEQISPGSGSPTARIWHVVK